MLNCPHQEFSAGCEPYFSRSFILSYIPKIRIYPIKQILSETPRFSKQVQFYRTRLLRRRHKWQRDFLFGKRGRLISHCSERCPSAPRPFSQHNRYCRRQARQSVPVVLQVKKKKRGIVPAQWSPSGCKWPSNQALPFTAAGLQRAAGLTSEGPASPSPSSGTLQQALEAK